MKLNCRFDLFVLLAALMALAGCVAESRNGGATWTKPAFGH